MQFSNTDRDFKYQILLPQDKEETAVQCRIKLRVKRPTRTDWALLHQPWPPPDPKQPQPGPFRRRRRHQGAMPHARARVCPNVPVAVGRSRHPSAAVRCLTAEPPQIEAIKDGRGRKAIESLSSSVCACRVGSTSGCRHSSSLIPIFGANSAIPKDAI